MGKFTNWVENNKNNMGCTCKCVSCSKHKKCEKCSCKNCECKGCGCKKNNKNIKENVMTTPENPMVRSKDDTNRIIKRLEMKLGQDTMTYRPLINYLSRNKDMLSLFNDILEKVGGLNVSSARTIIK